MPFFNGTCIHDDKSVSFIPTPNSRWVGAPLMMLQEMYWLAQQQNKPLDISFSYNVKEVTSEFASVVPTYTPTILSKTYVGACLRLADDCLKEELDKMAAIEQTQQLLNEAVASTTTDDLKLNLSGNIFRMCIVADNIVGCKESSRFVVENVRLKITYAHNKVISGVEQCYLRHLETDWVPKMCRNLQHPFRRLQEVIVAQSIINFLLFEKNQNTTTLSSCIPLYEPVFFSDPCHPLRFVSQKYRHHLWISKITGEGTAVILKFLDLKDTPCILLKHDIRSKKDHIQIANNVDPQKQIKSLTEPTVFIITQPRCPNGGIVFDHDFTWCAPHDTKVLKSVLVRHSAATHIFSNNVVARQDANKQLVQDLVRNTLYAGLQMSVKNPLVNTLVTNQPCLEQKLPMVTSPTPFVPTVKNPVGKIDFAKAVLTGVKNGVWSLVDDALHPIDNIILPINEFLLDASIIATCGAVSTIVQQNVEEEEDKMCNDAFVRMDQRMEALKTAWDGFEQASDLERVEKLAKLSTEILAPGYVLKSAKAGTNVKRVGQPNPTKYHPTCRTLHALEPVSYIDIKQAGQKFPDEVLSYVITTNGQLLLAKNSLDHWQIAKGKAVFAAGEVQFHKGAITSIDNQSGTFAPQGKYLGPLVETVFEKHGFDEVRGKFVAKEFMKEYRPLVSRDQTMTQTASLLSIAKLDPNKNHSKQ